MQRYVFPSLGFCTTNVEKVEEVERVALQICCAKPEQHGFASSTQKPEFLLLLEARFPVQDDDDGCGTRCQILGRQQEKTAASRSDVIVVRGEPP